MWNTKHDDKPKASPAPADEPPIAEGDLLGNFVRRTDDAFAGVEDKRLIGRDMPETEEEEAEREDR